MTFEKRDIVLYSFGLVISKYRKNLGLTQQKVASMIGVNSSFVGDIERGKRNISLISLLLICKALEIDFVETIREFEDLVSSSINE